MSPPAALAIAFGAVDTGSMKERLAFGYLSNLGHNGDDGDGGNCGDGGDGIPVTRVSDVVKWGRLYLIPGKLDSAHLARGPTPHER